MSDYQKLLKKAYQNMPKREGAEDRFVIPNARIEPMGAKTCITNFSDIATALRRDEKHLFKFLVKELATQGEKRGKGLICIGRFPARLIDKKIKLYVKEYVTCPECGKPDTQLVHEDVYLFLKCEACGAKKPVK